MPRLASVDPRLLIVYVLVVAVAAFATSRPEVLLPLLALQLLLWFVAGLSAPALLRSLRRLAFFLLLIVLSYALVKEEGDLVRRLPFFAWSLPVNITGLLTGLLRSTRVVTVILAAQIVQLGGDSQALVRGLRALRMPDFFAYGLDMVLAALGPEHGGGGGRGKGGGRGRGLGGGQQGKGFRYRQLMRGDLSVVTDRIEGLFAQSRERAAGLGLAPSAAADLTAIVSLTVLAMTLRFLRVVPGLPVAPGHKGILLIPLYILAHDLTRSRWGSTQYGLVMGATGFLLGMGKFGPFDILRHLTPGLFVDLVMPAVGKLVRRPGPWSYALVGMGAAATRISTIAAIALAVQAPPIFYALLLPTVIAHLIFGFLSGFVTHHLLRLGQRWRAAAEGAPAEEGATPPAPGEPS